MENSTVAIAQAIHNLKCDEAIKSYLRVLFNEECYDGPRAISFYVREAEAHFENWNVDKEFAE